MDHSPISLLRNSLLSNIALLVLSLSATSCSLLFDANEENSEDGDAGLQSIDAPAIDAQVDVEPPDAAPDAGADAAPDAAPPLNNLCPSNNNLVLCLRFEEIDENATPDLVLDESGTNNSVKLSGGYTRPSDLPGHQRSLHLEANALLQVDNSQSINISESITMEAWVNLRDNQTPDLSVFHKPGQYGLGIHSSNQGNSVQVPRCALTIGGGLELEPANFALPAPNTWNHIACVRNKEDQTASLFWNGCRIRFVNNTSDGNLITDNPPLSVSAPNYSVDTVRLWNTALSDGQIQSIYEAVFGSTNCNL